MPVSYANRKCVCGYTRFREAKVTAQEEVERWMLFEATTLGGFGSTPFGTFFGAGAGGLWGLFAGTLRTTAIQTVCESCSRLRNTKTLGRVAIFGSYIEGDRLYVVVSDLYRPAACYSVRLVGADGETYDLSLTWVPGLPQSLLVSDSPSETAAVPPVGAATVNAVLFGVIPEILTSQDFDIIIIDSCAGIEYTIATAYLESEPMIFNPYDANIGGAPRAWLRGSTGRLQSGQPSAGSRLSIPFDKCLGVIEYDPRDGTLPDAQGFTHNGTGAPGDYTLAEGGVMLGSTGLPSYWTKEVILGADPGSVYSYMHFNGVVSNGHAVPTDGFLAGARYATSIGAPYVGTYMAFSSDLWYVVRCDLGLATLVADSTTQGWSSFAVHTNVDVPADQYWLNEGGNGLAAFSATTGVAAAMVGQATFGDYIGSGGDHAVRHYVSSFGGRFIRAAFSGISPVSDPVLRMYGVADANASVSKTARFRVRYGVGTADPYALPASYVDATVNVLVANSVYEISFQLEGLTAKGPFDFTIERVWDHADDNLEATFHMFYATLRST